ARQGAGHDRRRAPPLFRRPPAPPARPRRRVGLSLGEIAPMADRLKFYGWGLEETGLDEAERQQLYRFVSDRLGIEPRPSPAPQIAEIRLRAPRVSAAGTLARILTDDPYERLLHSYGKSYPETVRAWARDFSDAPDLVALPETEADVSAI